MALPAPQLQAGGAQHPFANGYDQTRLFRQRDELERSHHASHRVVPADQRLGPHHAQAAAHLRLVVQHELALLQRHPQVALQRSAGGDRRLHHGVEEADAVAPGGLGGVHGQVGMLDQVFHRLALRVEQHGAHAGGAVHVVGCQLVGLVERQKDLLAHGLGLLGRLGGLPAQVLQQHQKLIAPEPGHRVALAHAGRQPLGDLLQQHIAHVVAQRVVQGLEVVQVQAQQRAQHAGAGTGGKRLLQPVHHQAAVGQVREGVVEGECLDLAGSLGALGQVAEHADVVRQHAAPVAHRRDAHGVEPHLAALAAVPDLAAPFARGVQAGPHGIEERFVVVAGRQQAGGAADGFFRVVASEPREGAVGAQDDGVRAGHHHALLRVECDGCDAQLALVAPARGDVLAHAPVACETAFFVEHRRAADGHPVFLARRGDALELEVAELLVPGQLRAVFCPLRIAHARRVHLPAGLADELGSLLHGRAFGAALQPREAQLRILLPVPV